MKKLKYDELTAMVVTLRAECEVVLPAMHGDHVYAAALKLIEKNNAVLSKKIHDMDRIKPMVVSLLGGGERRGNSIFLKEGTLLKWRICALQKEVGLALAKMVEEMKKTEKINIGKAELSFCSATTDTADDADAGTDSYVGLVKKYPVETKETRVHFVSPTTFRQKNKEFPIPLPAYFWGSLLSKWNSFAEDKIDEEKFVFAEKVYISNYNAATCKLDFGDRMAVAFLGKYNYRVDGNELTMRLLLQLLSRFSFYASVGWQTHCGMGQVRILS